MQVATLLAAKKSDYQLYLAGMVVLGCLCHFFVQINSNFTLSQQNVTLFDLTTGLSLGVLIVYGVRLWPAVLVGVTSGYFAVDQDFQLSLIQGLCVTIESSVGAYFLRYYLNHNFKLDYIPDVLKYFFTASIVVVLFGSSIISLSLLIFGYLSLNDIFFYWSNTSLGKITGISVIAPFIMVWTQKRELVEVWAKLLELIFLIVVLTLCSGIIFFGWFDTNISGYSRYPIAYMLFPILAWAAFRFGQRVSTVAAIIIAAFALLSLDNHLGPFSRSSLYESYFLTWLCINTASILSIILAADITYCKKVRVALQKSDERLDLAVSGSQDGLWDWVDIDNDEMWWSPNFYQLLDYRSDEVASTHKQLINLMHPDDRKIHTDAIKNHIEKGEPYNIDFRVQTKSQGYRWFHAKAKVTFDKVSGIKRMAGSIIDIDDRKIAQNEIIKLNKTLERRVAIRTNELEKRNDDLHREILERNKAELEIVKLQNDLIRMGRIMTMGEMASTLSHELHQPLMAIVNYSQSMLVDLNNKDVVIDDLKDNVEVISEQAIRGGEIIRNMKEFAVRGEMGLEPFDVNELVIKLRPLLDIEVVQNDVNFFIDLENKEMMSNLNHIQMQQVISNLVKNSIESMKYNSGGKKLCIKTELSDDGFAVIEVIDNGSGISSDELTNVFDSFYTTKSQGLGLGLSISKKIIDSHNGRLILFDNGNGTTARITLTLVG